MDDLHPEYLLRFRVKGFWPLLVSAGSPSGSIYDCVQDEARARRARFSLASAQGLG